MTRFLNLIRALFPQWNFFDRVSYQFELQYKENASDWKNINFECKRPKSGLLLNGLCNRTLAEVHLIEYFVRDVQEMDPEAFKKTSNLPMLLSLVRVKLRKLGVRSDKVQFRILALDSSEIIEIFVSDSFDLVSL